MNISEMRKLVPTFHLMLRRITIGGKDTSDECFYRREEHAWAIREALFTGVWTSDVLAPFFHGLSGLGTNGSNHNVKFAKCEI